MKRLSVAIITLLCLAGCYDTSKTDLNTLLDANKDINKAKMDYDKILIDRIYSTFSKEMEQDRIMVKPFFERAMQVKQHSDWLYKYIETTKNELIKEAYEISSYKDDTVSCFNVDGKVNLMNRIFLGRDTCAHHLKLLLLDYRRKILASLNCMHGDRQVCSLKDTAYLNIGLTMPKKNGVEWEIYTFKDKPVIAEIVELNSIEVDVRNVEYNVMSFFQNMLSTDGFKVMARIELGPFYGGDIWAAKEDLAKIDSITLYFSRTCDVKYDMTIVSDNKAETYHSSSKLLTNEMKSALQVLKIGDMVIIHNVWAKWDERNSTRIEGVSITVIDKDHKPLSPFQGGL